MSALPMGRLAQNFFQPENQMILINQMEGVRIVIYRL
jgi:hypothetical protein